MNNSWKFPNRALNVPRKTCFRLKWVSIMIRCWMGFKVQYGSPGKHSGLRLKWALIHTLMTLHVGLFIDKCAAYWLHYNFADPFRWKITTVVLPKIKNKHIILVYLEFAIEPVCIPQGSCRLVRQKWQTKKFASLLALAKKKKSFFLCCPSTGPPTNSLLRCTFFISSPSQHFFPTSGWKAPGKNFFRWPRRGLKLQKKKTN